MKTAESQGQSTTMWWFAGEQEIHPSCQNVDY